MSSGGGPTYRSNLPTTANGRARLLKLRAEKHRALRAIEEEIACDEETISACNGAIAIIEKTIAHSERALDVFESNLVALKEIKSRLEDVLPPLDLGVDQTRDEQLLATCQRVTTYVADSSGKQTEPLEEHYGRPAKGARELASMLVSLRLELSDWQENLVIAKESLEKLQVCKKDLEPLLERMDILLSPVRKVPNEVWGRIFFLVVADTDITPSTSCRKPIITTMANVCRNWRRVALGHARFWTRIDVPNASWWPSNIEEMVSTYAVRKASLCPTFILWSWFTSSWLSQAKMSAKRGRLYIHDAEVANQQWGLSATAKESKKDSKKYKGSQRKDLTQVNIQSLFGVGDYHLHLYIKPDHADVDWSWNLMHSRSPTSVTMQSTTPYASDDILEHISNYSACKDITLIDVWPSPDAFDDHTISGLCRLRLRLNSFTSFDIRPLLNPTLEDLDLWHDGDATFNSLNSEHKLPALHTLALSIHDVNLVINLRAPKLKSLTIYGSPLPSKGSLDYGAILGGGPASQLQQIRLVEWPGVEGAGDVVHAMKQLVALTPSLSHMSFASCALDGSLLLYTLKENSKTAFKELTIEKCSVVTQAECEELSTLVQKLHVYV